MIFRPGAVRSLFLGIASVLVILPAAPAAGPSWQVRISVEVRGEYRSEDKDLRCDGTYAFVFLWSGTMERDDEDYLLVHHACDLVSREFEEHCLSKDEVRVLTTDDVPDKPELHVKYFLRDRGRIRVNFVVTGFDVPYGGAADVFPLVLPASAENSDRLGGLHYGLFVKSGSNDVALDERQVLDGPAEREFSWTWAWQTRLLKADATVVQTNSHAVKVKITATPQ